MFSDTIEKEQYRSVIRFLFLDGKTCKEIKTKLDAVYGNSSSMTTVRYWFNEFKRGRSSVFDEERPSRPADVVTEEIVEKVHDMILADRRTKVHEVVEAVGVSYGTAFNILHDNLGMKKFRGDRGINPLDAACRDHDITYSRSKDLTKRHVADKILAEEARKRITAKDSTLGERAAVTAVWAVMKAKTKIGMDLKMKKKKPTKRRILSIAELKRYNRAMEGHGVYLAPYKHGQGVSTKKIKKIKKIKNSKETIKIPNGITINYIQLQQLAKRMRIPYFRGIFMRTTLPTGGVYRNESVNLDNADEPGTHWVTYAKRGDHVVYFDSFGNLRPQGIGATHLDVTQIEYNRTLYQHYDQSNCGQLCLQILQTVDDQFKN
ncbi:SETMR methyltransferase, partial [Acromyrmex charruanus]